MNKKNLLLFSIAAILLSQPAAYAMRTQEEQKKQELKQQELRNRFFGMVSMKNPDPMLNHEFMQRQLYKLRTLIKEGINFSAIADDQFGDTLFHVLVTSSNVPANPQSLEALGKQTVAKLVNAKNKLGQTPLYVAAERDTLWIEALVALGANVNEPNNAGATPLHKAAESNQKRTLFYLLAHGGDLTKQNAYKHTPYDAARRAGNDALAKDIADYATSKGISNFYNIYQPGK